MEASPNSVDTVVAAFHTMDDVNGSRLPEPLLPPWLVGETFGESLLKHNLDGASVAERLLAAYL